MIDNLLLSNLEAKFYLEKHVFLVHYKFTIQAGKVVQNWLF